MDTVIAKAISYDPVSMGTRTIFIENNFTDLYVPDLGQ